jgi:hypothetical protein
VAHPRSLSELLSTWPADERTRETRARRAAVSTRQGVVQRFTGGELDQLYGVEGWSEQLFINYYRHDDCSVEPGVEWEDEWSCACNDECPACGTKDIEPYDYEEVE